MRPASGAVTLVGMSLRWHARELRSSDFPADGPLGDRLCFALQYAMLAPSGHNVQPWRFRLRPDGVEVWADRSRSLPVIDPQDRELTISCGAALFNLRVAMEKFAMPHRVELCLEADMLGRLTLAEDPAGWPVAPLFEAIPRRHTHRMPFQDRPVEQKVRDLLTRAVAAEGARLDWLNGPRRDLAVSSIAEADRRLATDARYRRQLDCWMLSRQQAPTEDAPVLEGVELVIVDDFASSLAPLVNRFFDWGLAAALRDVDLALRSPALVLLSTQGDDPLDWVRCGQAMERLLLSGAALGIQASYLNQPIEIPELRAALGQGEGLPQLLLRLGYQSREPTSPPRRPVQEVLIPD
ncbi:MAG: nitroreductase family protein [Candidatus Eremiobacterota bacterium]